MIKVLFVCHGNICRSPMAEFIFKDMVRKMGIEKDFHIESKATSYEEIGNGVYPPVKRILKNMGIDTKGKEACRTEKADYQKFDFIIGMDGMNIRNMLRIYGADPEGKICKLLKFAGSDADVSDPWYTGEFNKTKEDVINGLKGFIKFLKEKDMIK